jgi:hypothetical protein
MSARVVSPSLALLRLGSYARQNRIHQALAEIGRIHKTIHILRTLDDEEYRRRMGRELNTGQTPLRISRNLDASKSSELPCGFICFPEIAKLLFLRFQKEIYIS